jgi:hypothetical protein
MTNSLLKVIRMLISFILLRGQIGIFWIVFVFCSELFYYEKLYNFKKTMKKSQIHIPTILIYIFI